MTQANGAPATNGHPGLPTEVRIAIIGAGFSGLGMAIRLEQAGIEDFVVLEGAGEIGGTWHYNSYPNCGCDVPSHLYSFSFAPNPDWSRTYSKQPEILAYLRRCSREFGVEPHIRYNTLVSDATWDEDVRRWWIQTSRGPVAARILIAGTGPLHDPKVPDLPGLENFRGTTFHSARWNHDHDLTGEHVASIGTGASAIQYVPAIQPRVEKLHVFERTAPWVLPHTDRPITDVERWLYRTVPGAQRAVRAAIYSARETLVLGLVKNPKLMPILEKVALTHLRRQLRDPALRDKATPDYTIGCKRMLPSNQWYPALAQPNVDLVTDGIAEIREHSIVTDDGAERPVDTIIFGTGFHVTDMPVAQQVYGRRGRLLDDAWDHSPRAHLGATVAGFPNLFLLLGPNTGLGHNSMIYMIESQITHVLEALELMDERGADSLEVRPAVERAFNREIDARNQGTVWNTGCASWYLDDTGRNATLWPDWTWRFRRRTARLDPDEYVLDSAVGARATAGR